MAKVLNMNRAAETIQLTEDPDAPVFKLDLTLSALREKEKFFRSQLDDFQKYAGELSACDKGFEELDTGELKKFLKICETIVDGMLGEGAFDSACEYLKAGADIENEELTLLLTPLVLYLVDVMNKSMLKIERTGAFKKYGIETNTEKDA